MEEIYLEAVDETYVQVLADRGVLLELNERFTFFAPGYQFSPKYKNKIWDGKIRLFKLSTQLIYKGLITEIYNFCEEQGYKLRMSSALRETVKPADIPDLELDISGYGLTKTPRSFQIDAFKAAICDRRHTILSATASGKTLMIYMIVRWMISQGKQVLILVPNKTLVTQIRTDFIEYSSFEIDSKIHCIMEGAVKDTTHPVTISTWQSIYTQKKSFFAPFDCIIGDECHGAKADCVKLVFENATKAVYRLGFTGTMPEDRLNYLTIKGLLGPVIRVSSTADLVEKGTLADMQVKVLIFKYNQEFVREHQANSMEYQEEKNFVNSLEIRNRFISKLVKSSPNNSLILFKEIDNHGLALYNTIKNDCTEKQVFLVTGQMPSEERERIRLLAEQRDDICICATFGVFATGTNIINLHSIILAAGTKSKITLLQSIGRGLRRGGNKNEVTIYDFADDLRGKKKSKNWSLKHLDERLKHYTKEGFKFKTNEINLI